MVRQLLSFILFFSFVLSPSLSKAQDFDWVRQGGDNGKPGNYGSAVAVDGYNNIVVTGTYSDGCMFNGLPLGATGYQGIFLARYDPTGNLTWLRAIGSDSAANGAAVAADNRGNIYLAGNMRGTAVHFTATDSAVNTSFNGWNSFLARYDSSGNLLWVRAMNGPADNKLTSLTIDPGGNVIAGGWFSHSVFFSDTSLRGGLQNIFLLKYDPSGDLIWASVGKSNNICFPQALASDFFGNVYATGKLSGDIAFNTNTLGLIVDQHFNATTAPAKFIYTHPHVTCNFTPECLQVSGSSGSVSDYISFDYLSNLENFKLASDVKVTGYGPGLGLEKAGGFDLCADFPLNTGLNNILVYDHSLVPMVTSTAYYISIGDSVNISLQRSFDTMSATLINYTQHYIISCGFHYDLSYAHFNTSMPNNGTYNIYFLGGGQNIYNYKLSSKENRNVLCAFAGNSIETGYFSGGYGYRYADRLYNNSPYYYDVNAGGGDATANVLFDTTELISLRPKYVFIDIGVNDAHRGVDTNYFRTEYTAIINALQRHGIKLVLGTLVPQGDTMVLPYNRAIRALSVADSLPLVDIWSALVDPATGLMLAAYNAGDNVHPNAAGNSVMAAAIAAQAPFLLSDTLSWDSVHAVTILPGGNDKVFVAKFDPDGQQVWLVTDTAATAWGNSPDNNFSCGNGISVDAAGNVYIAGSLLDAYYVGPPANITLQDAFLAKYDGAGDLLWQQRWGSSANDAVRGLAMNANGFPYVIGEYSGNMTIGGTALPAAGVAGMFYGKFDNAGNAVWLTTASGPVALGNAIAISAVDSSIASTGSFNDSAAFGNINAVSSAPASYYNYDIFVARQSDNTSSKVSQIRNVASPYTIFPNPATDNINIRFFEQDRYTISITDVLGRTYQTIGTSKNLLSVDISGWGAGIYYVSVSDDKGNTSVRKFVKI